LSGLYDGHVIRAILDRTFIDSEGIRWIIDYKTGTHSGGKVDEFLDREQERYQQQLEAYAALMSLKEDRPIRLGLYYPAIPGWRAWDYVP
jgi:RecB family exonuclease